jgi:hypothetical protein
MEYFKRTSNAFAFVYERKVPAGETVVVKMPPVSPSKRGVNDIGWQTDGDGVTLYGTLAVNPELLQKDEFWQEIREHDEINKTVSAIKIVNEGTEPATVVIRAILN